MSLITIDQLDMAVPDARYEDLVRYIDFLNEGMEKFEINTPNRISAFIAQLAHESADFRHTEENLNYSWQALRITWPGRFASDAFAQQYHRKPREDRQPCLRQPLRQRRRSERRRLEVSRARADSAHLSR